MADEFGIVNPVTSPFLERIVKEERLNRDNPRRQGESKSKPSNEEKPEDLTADETDKSDTIMSSVHIDLRI
jgi:hypothetical protein